jgi:hypothetical protein
VSTGYQRIVFSGITVLQQTHSAWSTSFRQERRVFARELFPYKLKKLTAAPIVAFCFTLLQRAKKIKLYLYLLLDFCASISWHFCGILP